MTATLRIVMAQLNMRVGDIPGNLERIIESSRHARDELGARVIVFPELSLCGYPPEDLLLRSSMQARISRALDQLCEQVQGIYVVVGYPWQQDALRSLPMAASWRHTQSSTCRTIGYSTRSAILPRVPSRAASR